MDDKMKITAEEQKLEFDRKAGTPETCEAGGAEIRYYAWRGLPYCARPLDPIQKLNIFMPAEYETGGFVNGYTRETAPIFLPNAVDGYMPGPADEPGLTREGNPNAIFRALEHGYVVASGGVRGRTSGKRTEEFFEGSAAAADEGAGGRMVGRAPALIVDYKAIIRYLRYNRGRVPGDVSRIITSGTSAGGALSALAGASGNSKDYEPYLREIGALEERDDVFAANCYCPICNLEHADAAYEWLFAGEREYHNMKFVRTENGVKPVPMHGTLTERQAALAQELKALFPEYVNALKLRAPGSTADGAPLLTLDERGDGPFRDYLAGLILESANHELRTHEAVTRHAGLMVRGSEAERQEFLTIADGTAVALDFAAFARGVTRMKPVPAFDALDLSSPENEEFGTETLDGRHFSGFSQEHTEVEAELAGPQTVRMMNPTAYIGHADTAKYWRIRHGVFDRDTSLAIPLILALLLENAGCQVDFRLPWGLPHSGDYDLPELFAWIDGLCGRN